jgi:signal transduction histidine kinase
MARAKDAAGRPIHYRRVMRRHALRVPLSQPAIRDALLALVLAILVELEILASDVAGPMVLLALLGLGATLPLAARRRAPVTVVAIAVVSILGLDALSEVQKPQITLLPLLVAAFSAGAYAARPRALAGVAIGLVGVLAAEPGDFIVMGPLLAGTWLVGRLVRSHSLQARKLAALTAVLEREQAENARLAVEHERVRIARELHDVVAHSVSVIVVQAGAERMALGKERDTTREVLLEIERTGREALVEMRRLVGVLRQDDEPPELAPQPSLDHIDELVQHVRRAGLPVELTVEGEPIELSPGVDVSAFRIVQEALTNTLKHAGPARAAVLVRYGRQVLELEVADDGVGTPTLNGTGHGLIGMRERVALHGGELDVESRPGEGFTIRANLPLERAAS